MKYHKSYSQKPLNQTIDFRIFKRLLNYLGSYKKLLIISIFLLLFTKTLDVFVPYLIGKLTNEALGGANLSFLMPKALLIIGFLLTSYFIDTGNILLKNWIGQHSLLTLRIEVFDHIQKMPLKYYDKQRVGRLMTYTIQDIDQINQMFSESVVPLFGNIFLLIGIVVASLVIDRKIGVVILFIIPFAAFLTIHFRNKQRQVYGLIRSIVSAMNSFIQEYLMGVSIIQHYGMQQKEKKEFEEINEDHKKAYVEAIHHFSFFYAGIDFLQSVSLILIFVFLIFFTPLETGFQAGIFFTYSLYVLMIFRPLGDLADRYNVLQSAIAAADRVFHVLDLDIEQDKKADVEKIEKVHSIIFKDVWFAYDKKNWVLKGVSFELRKGQSMAVVGVTGAGKSTIMNLLLRFYEFQKGTIAINGIDIRRISRKELRKHFSIVLQNPMIFSGTIADNLSLFDPSISKEKMNQALEYVGLKTRKLKERVKEYGKSLSSGEKQLISLARAISQDRDVVILDEATSNIDTPTERVIQRALEKIFREKTTLIIAHRLSTIRHVDKIVVMHEGRIKEQGTHRQLLANKGIYEKLYRMQYV